MVDNATGMAYYCPDNPGRRIVGYDRDPEAEEIKGRIILTKRGVVLSQMGELPEHQT